MLQTQLQTRDFLSVDITDQPGVRIAAVIALFHDFAPLLNRRRVLRRPPHADKLRNSSLLESVESADGRLGTD